MKTGLIEKEDYFQLTREEFDQLSSKSQFATLNEKSGRWYNIKYLPYAFTEHGITMLATILKSEKAIKISINIVNISIYQYYKEYLL